MVMSIFFAIFRNNFLGLDVYYGELVFEQVTQQPAYELLDFFSKFSGRRKSQLTMLPFQINYLIFLLQYILRDTFMGLFYLI